MKIKFNSKLINLISKVKKDKNVKDAKVIKFNDVIENNKEEVKTRKGAYSVEEEIKTPKINNKAQKIFIGMIMLLLLTITLNIRYKDYLTIDTIAPKDVSSVAVLANSDENVENTGQDNIVTATKAEEKVVIPAKKVEEKLIFSPPISGEIQKMYSIDKVIYSKTLQQWKTHDGLDISASLGSTVKAAEKGVVDSIYNDSFYGTTIKIEHISGYRSVYSNLDENVYVNVGESVVKGQKIGKVGNTAIGEYLDEPHLHFMVYLNDTSIDPTYIYN